MTLPATVAPAHPEEVSSWVSNARPSAADSAGCVLLPLRDRNGSRVADAIVDEADGHLAEYRWHLASTGYVSRKVGRRDGGRFVYLHRVILGLTHGDGKQADHVNRDRLDNRRANLRIVTPGENNQNLVAYKGASSRFRGVWWDKSRNRWVADLWLGGRNVRRRRCRSEVEAALTAESWRLELMPFAEPDPELSTYRNTLNLEEL